jgi:hypothetical protein
MQEQFRRNRWCLQKFFPVGDHALSGLVRAASCAYRTESPTIFAKTAGF